MMMGASPALAYAQPLEVYATYYYSESGHLNLIGRTRFEYCTYNFNANGAVYSLIGSSSAYQEDVLIGYCDEGNFEPV
jgi:hypothetical protein